MPIFKTNFAYSIFYFSAKIHLFFLFLKKNKIGSEKNSNLENLLKM